MGRPLIECQGRPCLATFAGTEPCALKRGVPISTTSSAGLSELLLTDWTALRATRAQLPTLDLVNNFDQANLVNQTVA